MRGKEVSRGDTALTLTMDATAPRLRPRMMTFFIRVVTAHGHTGR